MVFIRIRHDFWLILIAPNWMKGGVTLVFLSRCIHDDETHPCSCTWREHWNHAYRKGARFVDRAMTSASLTCACSWRIDVKTSASLTPAHLWWIDVMTSISLTCTFVMNWCETLNLPDFRTFVMSWCEDLNLPDFRTFVMNWCEDLNLPDFTSRTFVMNWWSVRVEFSASYENLANMLQIWLEPTEQMDIVDKHLSATLPEQFAARLASGLGLSEISSRSVLQEVVLRSSSPIIIVMVAQAD